jgi:hypothetical protein
MMDSKYKRFISNKKVCFVGPSSLHIGTACGDFIDSFDVVVKTNMAVTLDTPEYFHDFGRRCDVLYLNNLCFRLMWGNDFKTVLNTRGVKWVCCKSDYQARYIKGFHVHGLSRNKKKVNRICPNAVMGAYILFDLLDAGAKEIFVTGIDFFSARKKKFDGSWAEYTPGYMSGKIESRIHESFIRRGKDYHDMYDSTKYMSKLAQDSKRIKFDDYVDERRKKILQRELVQK